MDDRRKLVEESQLFDPAWYLASYPDAASAAEPLGHFLELGSTQGLSPGPDFDAEWYLSRYSDVRAAGVEPLFHYLQSGRREGRLPKPGRERYWENVVWQQDEIEDQRRVRSPRAIPIPNAELRRATSTDDLGFWLAIGEAWSQVASHFLPPDPIILDLGCGCGKMARFLMLHPTARYLGLDVLKPCIEWSEEAFKSVCGERFEFRHLDVFSESYNPDGSMRAEDVVLPVEDRSVNFVICASLFTHLLENEMDNYLDEITRCLQSGGKMLASIHNEPQEGQRFSGNVHRIDIDESYWVEACASHGLDLYERVGEVYTQQLFVLERK